MLLNCPKVNLPVGLSAMWKSASANTPQITYGATGGGNTSIKKSIQLLRQMCKCAGVQM